MAEDSVPDPPWKRATRQVEGRRSERRYAREHGGDLQPNSGGTGIRGKKGDIRQNGYLLDHKDAKGQKSFRLDKDDFLTHAANAASTPPGMLPAQIILFDGLRLRVLRDDDYLADVGIANTD